MLSIIFFSVITSIQNVLNIAYFMSCQVALMDLGTQQLFPLGDLTKKMIVSLPHDMLQTAHGNDV